MITHRIDAIDIGNRGLFTAIYGMNRTSEVYITSDMRVYDLHQAIYLYLRQEGYTTVFYDDKIFSYEESQIISFLSLETDKTCEKTNEVIKRDFFKGKGLMAEHRVAGAGKSSGKQHDHQSHHSSIQVLGSGDELIYLVNQTEGFFGTIKSIVEREPYRKIAVVFTNPNTLQYDEKEQKMYENAYSDLKTKYIKLNIGLKLIALYDFATSESFSQELQNGSDKFFMRPPFKDLLLSELTSANDNSGKDLKNLTVFYLGKPEKDEISNILNRKRLLGGGMPNAFTHIPWDKIVLKFWQGVKGYENLSLVSDFVKTSASDLNKIIINNMENGSAIDQLNSLRGIDKIKEQFTCYRESLLAQRNNEGDGFKPHMALMGSPGTGKTTVARLFGEILKDDGLLSKGHFVKVDVSDLVGEYVGSTRPKTKAVCEKALGGVLFIDEAYGLMSDDNEHGACYGKEAIEILIQYMEKKDFIVILAGYTEQINDLINKGNPGFKRRFNQLGFFHFDDYTPDVLMEIARKKIQVPVTDEFEKALLGILKLKYAYRNKKFGNAGDVENIVNLIVGNYRRKNDNGPLDIKHIPDELRVLVDPDIMNEETMLKPINCLIGQQGVKDTIRDLYAKIYAGRIRLVSYGTSPEIPVLNFIFSGNPGTGKTTIAHLMGELLEKMGVLSSPDGKNMTEVKGTELLEMRPSDIKRLFEDNIGKVLFIEEAYVLQQSKRVLTDIVGSITDPNYEKKLCVVMAGYSDDMQEMVNVNPGMERRFENIHFTDYSDEELWEILLMKIQSPNSNALIDASSCRQLAVDYFSSLPRDRNFGNAGVVDRLLETIKINRDKRFINATEEQRRDIDFSLRILPEDFPELKEPIEQISDSISVCGSNSDAFNSQKWCEINLDGEDESMRVVNGEDLYASVGLIEGKKGTGTAFVISIKHRLIMTASHVVENSSDFRFTLNNKGIVSTTQAEVKWRSFNHDLSILRVDCLPDYAKYFSFDINTERMPTTNIQIAAFPMGTRVSGCMLLTEGVISNTEKQLVVTDEKGTKRVFDAIRTEAQATHGSSGGPVMLSNTMNVIGVLHGGFNENGFVMNIASDIRQLFNERTLNIICKNI